MLYVHAVEYLRYNNCLMMEAIFCVMDAYVKVRKTTQVNSIGNIANRAIKNKFQQLVTQKNQLRSVRSYQELLT